MVIVPRKCTTSVNNGLHNYLALFTKHSATTVATTFAGPFNTTSKQGENVAVLFSIQLKSRANCIKCTNKVCRAG